MTARLTVVMIFRVAITRVRVTLIRRVERVLIDVIVMRVVQMAIVQVVDMIAVLNARMSACITVDMVVIGMRRVFHRRLIPQSVQLRPNFATYEDPCGPQGLSSGTFVPMKSFSFRVTRIRS